MARRGISRISGDAAKHGFELESLGSVAKYMARHPIRFRRKDVERLLDRPDVSLRSIGLSQAIRGAEVSGRVDHAFAVWREIGADRTAGAAADRFTFEPSMFIVKSDRIYMVHAWIER